MCFLYYPNLIVATRHKSCPKVKYGSLNCWGVFSSLYGMNMFGVFKYAFFQIQVLYSLTNTNNPAILDNLPYIRTLNGEVHLQKGHVNTIDIPAGWKLDWIKKIKPRLLEATKPVHHVSQNEINILPKSLSMKSTNPFVPDSPFIDVCSSFSSHSSTSFQLT